MTPAPDANPYSTPESSLREEKTAQPRLASLGQRIGGKLFDVLLGYLVALPLILTLDSARLIEIGRDSTRMLSLYVDSATGQLTAAATLALGALNWYLVATRGQSLGKMLVGSRIERTDGSPAGFLRGVVLRQWVMLAPSYLGVLGLYAGASVTPITVFSSLLGSIITLSYLLILGSSRRCGHDYIAGTRVVRVA